LISAIGVSIVLQNYVQLAQGARVKVLPPLITGSLTLAQGVNTLMLGNDAMVTDEFWAITGPAGEGTLITFTPDPRVNPANASLVQYFRSQRYEPEAYTRYTYAAVQSWVQAAAKAGTTNAARVSAALKANQFDTVMGRIGFNAKGDVTAPGYMIYVWKDGKYAYAQ